VEVFVEELLTKLEARVKQALERIEELESDNARLKAENDSLTETNLRLQGELEHKEEEVTVIAELRARLEASEAKQELARRRIEAIIAELDEILAQGAEAPEEPVEVETNPSDEEERPVPPGIAFPEEAEGSEEIGGEEAEEPTEDTFPLLDFEEGEEPPPDESEPFPGEGGAFPDTEEESDSESLDADDLASGEDDQEKDDDKDPFGGSF
jgi:FtsZ-binding cell division protein ZapB